MHSINFTIRQIFVYGIIGIGGTICHYLVLLGMVEIFFAGPVFGSSMGFVAGAVANHELNRKILFRDTSRSHLDTATRFLVIAVIGFLINLGIMFLLTHLADLYYLVAQVLATFTVFVITFFANRSWTFQL